MVWEGMDKVKVSVCAVWVRSCGPQRWGTSPTSSSLPNRLGVPSVEHCKVCGAKRRGRQNGLGGDGQGESERLRSVSPQLWPAAGSWRAVRCLQGVLTGGKGF